MLSGGFSGATSGTPYANYPIDATNSWEVDTDYGDPQLTAYVLCLQANFDAQIQTEPPNGTDTVSCPTGTLIGGGFQTVASPTSPVTASEPTLDRNGWTVSIGSGGSSNVTVYARCAHANLNGLVVNPQTFSNNNTSGTSVGCSNNQFLTGGGFASQDPTSTSVQLNTSGPLTNEKWTVNELYPITNPALSFQVTAYALCLDLP